MKEWQKWLASVVLVLIGLGLIALLVWIPYSMWVAGFVALVVGVKQMMFR